MSKKLPLDRALASVLLVSALGVSSIAAAHHGWSQYDATTLLTLSGTVRDVTIENPHGMLRLETPDKVWSVVLSPPSRMERRGLSADAIAVDGTVTVEGYPHQTVADELRAERITVGGQTVELR